MRFYQLSIAKKIIIVVIAAIFVLTVFSVLIEQCTHGALTPNYNRYWHPFSFVDVNWITVSSCIVAYIVLLLPWFAYYMTDNQEVYSKWGVFPASSIVAKAISAVLSLFGGITGLLCSVGFCYKAFLSITNTPTIMMDNEDRMIIFLFLLCVLFWGIVYIIYKFIYRDRWKLI